VGPKLLVLCHYATREVAIEGGSEAMYSASWSVPGLDGHSTPEKIQQCEQTCS